MKNKIISEITSREFLLYGVIGFSSASIDYILFLIAFDIVGMNIVIANILSTFIGISNSFIFNTFFNFKKADNLKIRFIKFFSVGVLGIFLNVMIVQIGVVILHFGASIIKVFAIIFAALVQYVLNSRITFS